MCILHSYLPVSVVICRIGYNISTALPASSIVIRRIGYIIYLPGLIVVSGIGYNISAGLPAGLDIADT